MKTKRPVNNYDKNRHPYLQPRKWADGTLCFWRNNDMYSEKSKKYFEDCVKRMIDEQAKINPAKLMDSPM